MTESEALAFRVMERVSLHGPVLLEELNRLLPDCTWNQLFATVDRLSREGRLEIHHPDRCAYIVRLRSAPSGIGRRVSGAPQVAEVARRNDA
jgi:hypothetical protein